MMGTVEHVVEHVHREPMVVQVPTWFLLALLIALPLTALIVWRVTRRKGSPPPHRP